MRIEKFLAVLGITAGIFAATDTDAAQKKALGHDDFDAWKSVRNHSISRNGEWSAYSVNPQEGDGTLVLYNTKSGKQVEIGRGYNPGFTADSRWAVVQIKAPFADTRKAKIAKKKDHEMPQDSLAIVNLASMKITKYGDVLDYKLGEEGGDWVAWKSCDTTLVAPKLLSDKECGRPLVIMDLVSGTRKVTNWVDHFCFSRNGARLALTVKKPEKDSLATNSVGVMLLPDTSYTIVDRDKAFYGMPALDDNGTMLAYTASEDSIKTGTRRAEVFLSDLRHEMKTPSRIDIDKKDAAGNPLRPNQYTALRFSHNGKRLIGGVAPVIAPDDTTIVDFEKGKLDIWVWDRVMTPPKDLSTLKEQQKNNYPVVVDIATRNSVLVTDSPLARVETPDRWDGDWALVVDPGFAAVAYQWDYFYPTPMHVVNVMTGEKRDAGEFQGELGYELSPCDRYVIWFEDRNYHVYDIERGVTREISGKVPYPLWDLDDRHPCPSQPRGIAGWSRNDERVLVYDRHDIWSLDPKGEADPVCLTDGEGRRRNVRFEYTNTDPEKHRFLSDGDLMLLSVFDYKDKYRGLATMRYGKPEAPAVEVLDKYNFSQIRKAADADVFTWQRANFNTSPDIWLSRGTKFAQARRLSDANPQMSEYSWGTARLERWYAYDGSPSEGVLYVPENIDPNKKYPMLCVFYETGSEDLYVHYTMEPSWSWVNYPFYVSRGYVVFVPDIHYTSGRPGEDAYNYVCSGAEEMCRRYPWIDKDRIGIDGQSWGGYQTAYLVTRTDMFACAGSGAPVANMTSAYGGIRWGTGDSRQAQYEVGQSRIGGTLWERPEMYIQSSPVFHADRVHTPLLIMHNDEDGAVPWYQGIEMFMALRRLQRPVWMLQYNGEAHNIRARKNRKDITKRFQQFFDHYLKGDPMPKWMKEGIPAIRKGQEWNFELMDK